jgi:Protein of unknown function (DUF3320)
VKSDEVAYRECKLQATTRKGLLDLTANELALLVGRVIDVEGPVHASEVARRIRESFRLQRTGQRILSRVEESLNLLKERGTAEEERDFWFVKGRIVSAVRSRRLASPTLRKADMIAPSEYRLAIKEILKDAVAANTEEIIVEAARRFGFERTGGELKEEIAGEINIMLKAQSLVQENGKLRLR